ncbi:1801_t:CDS:2, partial [Cetraspora pellucida]
EKIILHPRLSSASLPFTILLALSASSDKHQHIVYLVHHVGKEVHNAMVNTQNALHARIQVNLLIFELRYRIASGDDPSSSKITAISFAVERL